MQIKIVFDGGAYAAGKIVPNILPGRIPKTPYSVPDAKIERMARLHEHRARRLPARARRRADPFALESHLDVVARELQLDPLELRLRNAIAKAIPTWTGIRTKMPTALRCFGR